jgi:hypothetical protein
MRRRVPLVRLDMANQSIIDVILPISGRDYNMMESINRIISININSLKK